MSLTDFLAYDLLTYLRIRDQEKEIELLKESDTSNSWTIQELQNRVYRLEQELIIRKLIEEDLLTELNQDGLSEKVEQKIEEFLHQPETHCPQCERELKADNMKCMYCGWQK